MDIPFKPIRLEDKEIITSFTFPSDYRNCDFSFANMCSWRFLYDSEFAIVDGYLLIRFMIEDKSRFAYMMPVGDGDLAGAVRLLEEDSLKYGHPLCMLGITPDAKEQLEGALPGSFFHINNFKKRYSYEYVPITPDIVPQCLKLECKWYKANNGDNDEEELNDERRSLTYALHHFDSLGLIGGALRVDNEIIAFSFGAPINHNTFGVHVEKADVNFDGAYTVINQEFASHLPEQYTYVNREEDLGIPGLRQAKLSYQPTILLEKSAAIKKQLTQTK